RIVELNDQRHETNGVQEKRHGERDLEMHHTHYFLLDDGTLRRYDIKDYRTRLAIAIANGRSMKGLPVPVVTIVVEGGRDTIKNIYYDLRRDIPIVIIEGSGRVADFFSLWLTYTKEMDNLEQDPEWTLPIDIGELEEIKSVKPRRLSKIDQRRTSKLPQQQTTTSENSQEEQERNKLPDITEYHLNIDREKKKFKDHETQIMNGLKLIVSSDDDVLSKEQRSEQIDKKVQDVLLHVMYCLQPAVRGNITIYNLNTDQDLSDTVFRSICKSRQKYLDKLHIQRTEKLKFRESRLDHGLHTDERQRLQQQDENKFKQHKSLQNNQLLDLAMDWNAFDVAKDLIIMNTLANIT
ncbi:unnamed protein product, partial [Didymodactylos carnosus]